MAESPKVVRRSFERAIDDAIRNGMRGVYLASRAEARKNLTGRMMQQRTGRTLRDVMRESKPTADGFKLATTLPSLVAWMKGSDRKGYWVRPVKARALAWRDPQTGQIRFSKGHYINPWKFTPVRPVFTDAVERVGSRGVLREMQKAVAAEFRKEFRSGKLTVRLIGK